MRSERDRWEPKTLWTRFGPTALSFAIVGVGVAGALRIVRAEDNSPITIALRAEAPQDEKDASKRAEDQLEAATRAAKRADEVARVATTQQDEAAQKELEALEKQRAALDEKIASLRRRSGIQRDRDTLRLRDRLGDNAITLPRGRELSADERKAVEEAMKTAQEAMRMAEKAMQEALRAAPRGENFRFFGGDGARVIVPPIPAIPAIPKIELKDLPRVKVDGKGYLFRSDGANPRVWMFDGKEGKELKWNSEEWQKWQKEFEAEWSKKQPEFEKQMRELQERMEKWSREFEARMRTRFREEEEKAKSEEKTKSKKEESEKSEKTDTTIKSTSSEGARVTADYEDIL